MLTQSEKNNTVFVKEFLEKHSSELSAVTKEISVDNVHAKIVPDTQKYLEMLGKCIRDGELVAFPTETVYGLGADATNQSALLKIYETKRRPLTDPIIAHVLDYEHALPLIDFRNDFEKILFKKLTEKFWPGPLTIILKANLDILPKTITAQTGFVGIRAPKHPYARKLLQAAKKPIGAPSANLFSHVSPTSSVHVFNDFYDQPVNIVDGDRCEYGIESTVIKIQQKSIIVLREGSLLTKKLKQYLDSLVTEYQFQIQVSVLKKVQKKQNNQGMEAPGQLLKHYAPYLPCFSVSFEKIEHSEKQRIKRPDTNQEIALNETALILLNDAKYRREDLLKKFKHLIYNKEEDISKEESTELEQQDKFCSKEEKTKMRHLYYLLRKAQNVDAKVILIAWDEPQEGTIWDKVFRATQGNQAIIL